MGFPEYNSTLILRLSDPMNRQRLCGCVKPFLCVHIAEPVFATFFPAVQPGQTHIRSVIEAKIAGRPADIRACGPFQQDSVYNGS